MIQHVSGATAPGHVGSAPGRARLIAESAVPVPPPAPEPRAAPRVVASPFPRALERYLVDALGEIKRKAPLAPVLIIAPSLLLLDRVKRIIAQELRATLNVSFHYHRRVAEVALREMAGMEQPTLRVASREVLERLLGGVLDAQERPLARYARAWRGGPAALLSTLRDLRDAGVAPDALDVPGTPVPAGGDLSDLRAIYEAYLTALRALADRGLTDAAGLVEAALPHAGAWASRFHQVFHHGAYDLIGVHAELMRTLAARVPVTWLVPAHPDAPAFEMGRRLIARIGPPAKPAWISDGPPPAGPAARAPAIYDENGRFDRPLPAAALELFHAQGGRAEAEHAASLAQGAIAREDVLPEEIAIVALDGALNGSLLLPALRAHGVPSRADDVRSLATDPLAQAFLYLLRALFGDLERQAVIDLLRSPAYGPPGADAGDLPFLPDLWDRWSRGAGVIRGREMWLDGIAGWLEARRRGPGARNRAGDPAEHERLEGLRARIDALLSARDAWLGAPSGWCGQAETLRRLGSRFLRRFDEAEDPAGVRLHAILDDLARLDLVADVLAGLPVSPQAALDYLEEAIGAATLPPADRDAGGVRVTDLMQIRTVPFRRVILLDFNQGLFPRKPREDPFLPDEARGLLRERTGRPLPLKREADVEERMLLALLVAAAEERLSIGWQRADAEGKARSPSLALREIARIRDGVPFLDSILEREDGALRLPSHPLEALARRAGSEGGLSASDAFVAAGLGLSGTGGERGEALRALRDALGRPDPAVLAGLSLLERIERWHGEDLGCDGIVGAAARALLPDRFGVSALQRLGRCPLAFFFRHVLDIREIDEAAEESEIEPQEMGELIHALLFRIYDRLHEEGRFGRDGEQLLARGLSLLDACWDDAFEGPSRRIGRFLPLLWETLARSWREAVEAFLRADLTALAGQGGIPFAFEQTVEEEIDLTGPVGPSRLALVGRIDRVVRYDAGRYRVGDYKTSGNPSNRIKLLDMLRGSELQIPLYALAVEARLGREGVAFDRVEGEILALGPDVTEGTSFAAAGPLAPDADKYRDALPGIRETAGVLLALAREGNFPMTPGNPCRYCAYARACRRTHPPSVARIENAPGLAALRAVRAKTTKSPLLANGPRAGAGKAPRGAKRRARR